MQCVINLLQQSSVLHHQRCCALCNHMPPSSSCNPSRARGLYHSVIAVIVLLYFAVATTHVPTSWVHSWCDGLLLSLQLQLLICNAESPESSEANIEHKVHTCSTFWGVSLDVSGSYAQGGLHNITHPVWVCAATCPTRGDETTLDISVAHGHWYSMSRTCTV